MAMPARAQAVIGVSGIRTEPGGLGLTEKRVIRIDLPATVTEEHTALMQRDLAIIAEIAQQNPKDMTDLHNAVAHHQLPTATQLAYKMGLTEQQVVARGGGQVGVGLGVLALLVLVAVVAGSDEPTTPEPVGPSPEPSPDDGGTDGGLPPGEVGS